MERRSFGGLLKQKTRLKTICFETGITRGTTQIANKNSPLILGIHQSLSINAASRSRLLTLLLPLTWEATRRSALGSEGIIVTGFCRFTPTTDSLKDTTCATVFVTAFKNILL